MCRERSSGDAGIILNQVFFFCAESRTWNRRMRRSPAKKGLETALPFYRVHTGLDTGTPHKKGGAQHSPFLQARLWECRGRPFFGE
jgi:hypothetical protein